MAIKDWFSKKASEPEVVVESGGDKVKQQEAAKTLVVHTNILDRPSKTILKGFNLRQGMWVVTAQGTGIVTGLVEVQSPSGTETHVKVALVDSVGENRSEASFLPSDVRQARLIEIPTARRPAHAVAHLGYV